MNAQELREKLVDIWPPIAIGKKDFDVDIGPMDFSQKTIGMLLDDSTPKDMWKDYCRSRGAKRDNIKPILIVVSSDINKDEPYEYLRTAVHEYSHLTRGELSILYPPAVEPHHEMFLKASITNHLTKYDEMRGYEEQEIWHFLDYYLGKRWEESKPLLNKFNDDFGFFPVQFDNYAHDPLFHFIDYTLSTMAEKSGFYKIKSIPIVSTTYRD